MESAASNRAEEMLADLELARREAEQMDFDPPSPVALARAAALLRVLADSRASLDIAIGVDGAIEVDAVIGGRVLTIEIVPSGKRMEMIVRDIASGDVILPAAEVTEREVMTHLAAAA